MLTSALPHKATRALRPFAAAALLSVALASLPASAALANLVSDRIYPAPHAPLSLAGLPAAARLISVLTRDGLMLNGVETPARPGMPTLLMFHGNASSASGEVAWFHPLADRGYGLVSAEFRGYSANPGKPSEAGLTADADAFYDRARKSAGAGPLWIVGHSLGAGVALACAQRRGADAVLTIGAFRRLRTVGPALLRWLVPDAFVNEVVVPKLKLSYYLVHGTADRNVPWRNAQELHRLAGAAHLTGASFVVVGAGHQPSGAVLAQVFEAVRTWRKGSPPSLAALPEAVRVIPFGQSKPLSR